MPVEPADIASVARSGDEARVTGFRAEKASNRQIEQIDHQLAQQLPSRRRMHPEPPEEPASQTPDPPPRRPRFLTTEELFAGEREVWIQHGEQRYRLRITAAGKLILTK